MVMAVGDRPQPVHPDEQEAFTEAFPSGSRRWRPRGCARHDRSLLRATRVPRGSGLGMTSDEGPVVPSTAVSFRGASGEPRHPEELRSSRVRKRSPEPASLPCSEGDPQSQRRRTPRGAEVPRGDNGCGAQQGLLASQRPWPSWGAMGKETSQGAGSMRGARAGGSRGTPSSRGPSG